ncbi:MAG: transglutaminase-like putative cysteine protease [Flavobacteriales bacterium]
MQHFQLNQPIPLSTPLTQPSYYINSDHPTVLDFVAKNSSPTQSEKENSIQLYYAIRDGIWYDPNTSGLAPDQLTASYVLERGTGHCVEKAVVLAACMRALGIPAKLEFFDVKNHIASQKLLDRLRSDVFAFHGLTQIYLDGKWVKATPAFNAKLCEKFNVTPLEFNGETDSQFQEFDADGGKFMEYLHHYGTFDDMPRELFIGVLIKHYPHLFPQARIQEFLWDKML